MQPRRPIILVGFALFLLAPSCRRREEPSEPPEWQQPRPPVDSLARNELAEGPDKAFGLVLPRQLKVTQRFADVWTAEGDVTVEAMSAYVRARVVDGKATVGASSSVFDQVRTTPDSNRRLRVRIEPAWAGHACKVEVRDVTPAKLPPLATEEDRWREVGMTPQGKVIDPRLLE